MGPPNVWIFINRSAESIDNAVDWHAPAINCVCSLLSLCLLLSYMDQEVLSQLDTNYAVEEVESADESGIQTLTEFYSLMAQSGDETVISPRLPGVPLPLQVLMNACPEPVTVQNAHKFLAEAQTLLQAARAKMEEKSDEKTETEQETEEAESESKKKLN